MAVLREPVKGPRQRPISDCRMSNPDFENEDSGRFPAERSGDRYVVRYGLMRLVAEFSAKGPQKLVRNAAVIARTSRGVEWGEVLCPATERTADLSGKPGEHRQDHAAGQRRRRPPAGRVVAAESGPSSTAAAK